MAPHGDRKKWKGPDRPDKPELPPNRKEFKKHRTEQVEKGGGIEQQEQQPAPHAAALDADDGDFPRGGRSLLSRDEREEARTEAEAELEKEERRGKKKRNANVPLGIDGHDDLGTLFGGATTGKLPRSTLKVGAIVSGVVERLTPEAVVVSVNGFSKGSILNEHLADYHGQAAQLKNLLTPGHEFNQLLVLGKIASLKYSHDWVKSFSVGSLVKGEVRGVEEHGVILHFKHYPDVIGLLEHHQLGGTTVKVGSSVKGIVVDSSDGVVNLSLKPELVDSVSKDGKKKKRRRAAVLDLELDEVVNAVVEIVKDSHMVLSVPEYNHAIGFAPLMDYNSQLLPHHHYAIGESITVIVGSIPTSDPSGRLILLPKAAAQDSGPLSSKRSKRKSDYKVGSLVEAKIIDIKPLELILKFGVNLHGRIHITEVLEEHCCENPFIKLKIGQQVLARIVAEHSARSGRNLKWELSVKPSVLKDSEESKAPEAELNHSINGIVRAYVVQVDKEWVRLSVSRDVMAQLFILDSSVEPSELKEFQQRYSVGQAVKGQIIEVNRMKRLLRLKALGDQHMLENADVTQKSVSSTTEHMREGNIIGGRIQRILPGIGGLVIQIGPHLYGRVHYTEIVHSWVPEPLSGFHEGQFMKCKVLAVSRPSEGSVRVELSLRSSILCANHNHSRGLADDSEICAPWFEKINDLSPGTEVKGYVKNVNARGCFIMLSRMVEARIILSNLSDEYVENPQKDFSVGMLVQGRVLSAEPISGKVEVSLRKSTDSKSQKVGDISYSDLRVGDIVDGKVKQVESYGLFVAIQSSKLVGLCHVSELSDEPVLDTNSCFKVGDMVKAKILKIDEKRHRVSISLKKPYFDPDLTDCINDNKNISHGAEMSGDLNRTLLLPVEEPKQKLPTEILPTDVLVSIYNRVPCLVARHHMRQVCGSAFRKAVASSPIPDLPSLLLARPGGPSFSCVLGGCKTHQLHVPIDARVARFFGSFDGGWAFLSFGKFREHTLLNLRTKERLRLPNTALVETPLAFEKSVLQDMVMLGATLSAQPNQTEPCIGAAISCCRSGQRALSFWKIRDEVADGRPKDTVEDVIFCRGMFHVLTADETVIVYMSTVGENGQLEIEQWPMYKPRGGSSGDANVLARYLMVGEGFSMFMVVRYGNSIDPQTISFRVFKLESGYDNTGLSCSTWDELHDLAGQIMFVGRCCSRVYDAVKYPGLKEGVYFLDDNNFFDMTWFDANADSSRVYSSIDSGRYTVSLLRLSTSFALTKT